jgi:hypothetical protein
MTEGGGRGTLHSAEQLLEEESNYVKMQRIGSFLLTFLAFTATARATNWFILNGATERCVSAEAFAAKRGGRGLRLCVASCASKRSSWPTRLGGCQNYPS